MVWWVGRFISGGLGDVGKRHYNCNGVFTCARGDFVTAIYGVRSEEMDPPAA